jgi:hypothetical protein
MKISLRLVLIIVAALPLTQCTEEEIQVAKDQFGAEALTIANTSTNLTNAFTIGATPLYDYDEQVSGYDFQFYMKGSGSITINWGDGAISTHQFTDSWDTFTHGYASTGEFAISITGDLKNITYFDTYYGMGSFNAINFKRLMNLEEVSIGLTESSRTLDFSRNIKLSRLSLAGMQDLETVILPKRHNISTITIDGPFNFDATDIDGIIENIYNNAVAKNITGGMFTLYREWYQEEGDYGMIGPPSPTSMEMLNTLKTMYGWSIYPSADAVNM